MIALNDRYYAVYMLSFSNGKSYIGVTIDVIRRFKEHKRHDTLIGRAIRKHGFPEPQILAICSEEYAYDLEQIAIERFDTISPNGYNLMEGGVGGSTGRYVSNETRKKMSESHTGKSLSKEHRENISKGLVENPRYDDWRKNISKGNSGKIHSEATKQKMSLAQREKKRPPFSAKWRAAISNANRGSILGSPSEEHKRKISESKTGIPNVKARGQKRSVESRQRMSEAQKLRWKRLKVKQG